MSADGTMSRDTLSSVPLGSPVPNWKPPPEPGAEPMTGQFVRLEPLDAEAHAATLFAAYDGHDELWHYMHDGPFHSAAQYHRWVREAVRTPNTRFYALRDLKTRATFGVASYLRIAPQAGSIEIGNICIAPSGQRSRAMTEAMFLMMQWPFEAGYRRCEWKCNALNIASRRAAQRLGFSFEGVFRQAAVVKGRNRDTAWFAAIDQEWPALRAAFESWMSPRNFDDAGRQIERLSDLTRLVRAASDPALERAVR